MKVYALIALAVLVTSVSAAEKPTKEELEASAKKIKELRKQRVETLQAASESAMKLAQNGRLDVWDAMETRMELFKALLDATEKDADRIVVYKAALESLKVLEDVAKARHEAARGTELPVLKVRARRLEIEIAMEKEKMKDGK